MARTILSPFALEHPLPAARRLVRDGWLLNDPQVTGDAFTRMATILRGLTDLVAQARRDGELPVSIGGDCCQPIGVLAGLHRGGVQPVLLWLDAHGDFNTFETTPSGFVGGMPLAMLTGRGDQRLVDAVRLPSVADADVVLSDARDLDPLERDALEVSGIAHVRRLDAVLEALPVGRPVYVHLDVDVIDVEDAPAVQYPVRGGPSASAVRALLAAVTRTRTVAAVSMTLWDVEGDRDGRTAAVCRDVLTGLTGTA